MELNQLNPGKYCITFDQILEAHERIKNIALETPVLTSRSLNEIVNHGRRTNKRLFFKVEAMQRTGSFKFRGALNATLSLVQEQALSSVGKHNHQNPSHGTSTDSSDSSNHQNRLIHVVTHSSGNHAAALAFAAKIATELFHPITVQATIVMPQNAPLVKKTAVESYGGDIVLVENTNEAREEMASVIVHEHGAQFVHPSEDPRVIAGQGTVSLEFVRQVQALVNTDLDTVIIPVGGGGLASGNTIALRNVLGNNVKIVLAEPSELDDAKRSKESGQLLGHNKNNALTSVADGLKTTLGLNTWPIVRDLVDDIVTVSEVEILHATKLIWERLKVCIEPSAGVGVAVALSEEFHQKFPSAMNIGIILCGGNVDVIKLVESMKLLGIGPS